MKTLQKAQQSEISGAQTKNGTVADVTMTSDMSKKLTVNGLKDGAKVEVSSDNENAVTAAYADGEVTLTSKTSNRNGKSDCNS